MCIPFSQQKVYRVNKPVNQNTPALSGLKNIKLLSVFDKRMI